LLPASGAEDREYLLPFAHFLVRRGVAVLGYDKRGVGSSTGDWKTERFDDLARDATAAYAYLRTRPEIDRSQIGLLGLSQAGWVMPLAAVRAQGIAILLSISGAGVSPAETTIDEARGEIAAAHTPSAIIEQIVTMMKLQYAYAQTGRGWNEYIAARAHLVERMGTAPATIPGTQDDPYWMRIQVLYLYDPGPTLRHLQTPTLALFGALDDNIVAEKNRAAWESALKTAGNRDYTLRILDSADHVMLEAKVGNNAEEPTLEHFVLDYFTTVQDWLATRIRGFKPSPIGPSPLQ
jgi:pimeloyl-ACP methyl ester carboxylesterase